MTVTLWTYFFYTYSQDREDEEVRGASESARGGV